MAFLNTALSGNMSRDLLLSYSKIVATSYSQLVIDQKVCKLKTANLVSGA